MTDTQTTPSPNNGMAMFKTTDQMLRQQLLNPSQHNSIDGLNIYDVELQNASLINLIDNTFPSYLNSATCSISNNVVALGYPELGDGSTHIYEWDGSSWVQRGSDINGDTPNGETGWSTDLSSDGNILVVSSRKGHNGSNVKTGKVDVYEWDGSAWISKGNPIYGTLLNDNTGASTSISSDGNILAVGSPQAVNGSNVKTGKVNIYEWNGTTWVSKGNPIYGPIINAVAGESVSISSDGNVVAFGTTYAKDGSNVETGAVDVYEWNGSSWVSKGNTFYGTTNQGITGTSVDISSDGNTLVFGSPKAENESGVTTGSVEVYDWNGSVWVQRGDTFYGVNEDGDAGRSVSISSLGTVVAYGEPFPTGGIGAGRVHVYEWDNVSLSWYQKVPSFDVNTGSTGGGTASTHTGHSVSLSYDGNVAVYSGTYQAVKRVV